MVVQKDAVVHLLERGAKPGQLTAKGAGYPVEFDAGYAFVSRGIVAGDPCLFGYRQDSGQLSVYHCEPASPWLRRTKNTLSVGKGHDMVEPFVLGNRTHLLCYSGKSGAFTIFEVHDDFSLSRPFEYRRAHDEGATLGFTMVKPFSVSGQVAFMGYNGDSGRVAIYTIAVTESSDDTLPLKISWVWSHQWARGWTRFAFFKLGGGTYFFKTNTVRPNVNIDHVLDGLTGTTQIGTKLDLKDAQSLSFVEPFEMEHGAPYFLTYEKRGEITLNRFHSDCKGWDTESTFKTKPDAAHAIPFLADGTLLVIVS